MSIAPENLSKLLECWVGAVVLGASNASIFDFKGHWNTTRSIFWHDFTRERLRRQGEAYKFKAIAY
jgi:hypothetical protein